MTGAADGSNVLSEAKKAIVISRDHGLCILCGMDPTQVAHIIPRKSGDHQRDSRVYWIRQLAPVLSLFRKDNASNLICLCPTHHTQFDLGYFVLVPSPNQRDLMKRHELQDFAKREEIIRSGGRDPGRTFPELSDEFEYIPIRRGAYRIHLHNPTPYDQHVYHFDNADHWPCPLLHFKASHIALMLVSGPYLANRARFQSLKADIAESEVLGLLKLYQRRPFLSSISTTTVSAQYGRIPADLVELLNTLSSASVFSSSPVPVSQPLESRWH